MHVTNLLDQPTTVHFHGIIQNGTNWADGPSGVTQCPISPGGTYTYEFPITGELQYGTYVSLRKLFFFFVLGESVMTDCSPASRAVAPLAPSRDVH